MLLLRRVVARSIRPTARPSPLPPCTFAFPSLRFYSHDKASEAQATRMHLGFSKQDLLKAWHKAAREVSPADLTWEGRDHLQAQCTILRADGTVEKRKEPLSKQHMIDEFGMQPRDLRSLDAHIMDVRPSLLVCKRSIILCTPIARAVISHDQIVLVGGDPAKNPLATESENDQLVEALIEVMHYLEVVARAAARNGGPGSKGNFEFRALEGLLWLTVRGFKVVGMELHDRVHNLVPQLRFGVSPAELRDLLEAKRACEDSLFSGRALQSAIAAVLKEDEDLAGLYLTDKFNGLQRESSDHQTGELLLEYYERRLDESNESALRLSSLLADLDSNITLVLASTRVRLQNLELQSAIGTLSLAVGATLASFFGMNLVSGLENSSEAFLWVSASGVCSMGAILVVGWIRLLRARKSQLFLGSAGKFSAAAVDRHERTGKFPAPLKEIVMKDAGTVTTVEKRKEKDVLQVDTKREAKEKAVAEEKGLHDTADKKDGSQI